MTLTFRRYPLTDTLEVRVILFLNKRIVLVYHSGVLSKVVEDDSLTTFTSLIRRAGIALRAPLSRYKYSIHTVQVPVLPANCPLLIVSRTLAGELQYVKASRQGSTYKDNLGLEFNTAADFLLYYYARGYTLHAYKAGGA